jgi:uncharacterized damage-inducible protein DinB
MRQCVESLTQEQLWWRPNDASNSVGNLLLHLNGNVRQWLVGSFRELEDTRNRPVEFSTQEGASAAELLSALGRTLDEASEVLSRLTEADLLRRFTIQGYDVTGLEAVYKVVEHFASQTGPGVLLRIEKERQRSGGLLERLSCIGRQSYLTQQTERCVGRAA